MAVLAFADPAAAARSADAAAAQALFDHGRAAAQRGDWQTACDSFAESQRLDPGVGTLLNWANCEAHQGKVASAWQHFNEADSLLDPADDRHAYVRREIRKLAPKLPRLTLRLAASAPPQTRVLRAGTELGAASLGVPIPVDPGRVELSVLCEGRKARQIVLSMSEAEQRELVLEAGEELPPPVAALAPLAPQRDTLQRDLGLSLIALGSLSAGLGLASGVVVAKRNATAEQHCPNDRCDSVGLAAASNGERWLTVNTLAWSLGAAALVTGTTLLVVAPSPKRDAALHVVPGGAALVFQERY